MHGSPERNLTAASDSPSTSSHLAANSPLECLRPSLLRCTHALGRRPTSTLLKPADNLLTRPARFRKDKLMWPWPMGGFPLRAGNVHPCVLRCYVCDTSIAGATDSRLYSILRGALNLAVRRCRACRLPPLSSSSSASVTKLALPSKRVFSFQIVKFRLLIAYCKAMKNFILSFAIYPYIQKMAQLFWTFPAPRAGPHPVNNCYTATLFRRRIIIEISKGA